MKRLYRNLGVPVGGWAAMGLVLAAAAAGAAGLTLVSAAALAAGIVLVYRTAVRSYNG